MTPRKPIRLPLPLPVLVHTPCVRCGPDAPQPWPQWEGNAIVIACGCGQRTGQHQDAWKAQAEWNEMQEREGKT